MRRFVFATSVAVIACLSLTACGPDAGGTPAAAPTKPPEPATIALTPTAGTAGAPISTEVGVTITHGKLDSVSMVVAGTADAVAGAVREDGTSWVPSAPLAFGTGYQATVTAKGDDGKTQTQTTTFTTMGKPGNETGTSLNMFDGETVGVAMPIVIRFDTEVPEAARASVQQRLFVTTDPPQPGVWQWSTSQQLYYRPPIYWQPGTKISVRVALAGVPMGNGSYGDADQLATATVGNKVFMSVDNATKQMSVYINDQLTRNLPVSMGKPSTPSSSGFMVLMTREPTTRFDTRGEPNGGYVVDVNWAMRLTWGGEFIHAAPWSVAQQGNTNVSHGCLNLSDESSKWLFDQVHIGDPIIVRGTETALENGNGWTAWNQTWADYIKGSALPVPPALAAAQGVDPLTGAVPPPPAAASAAPAASGRPAVQPAPTR